MIWKLLKKNISAPQIAGYAAAALVGLSIIITAVKFYGDVAKAMSGNDLANNQYIVVSPPVTMFDSFAFGTNSGSGISNRTINELKRQPWVADMGEFRAANFNVTASVDINGKGMWSYLFLESVPDRFIDNLPKAWHFDPSDPHGADIPIIVPREYLSLYNFGFASSHNMPQMSENLAKSIRINLSISGNGRSEMFHGRIVGFSDRINTIAVPESFIDWGNEYFSARPPQQPSRIIIKTDHPGDPAINKFLARKHLVTAQESLKQGQAYFLLRIVTAVVVSIGAVICILALFVLSLSITLLLQKNREKNAYLLLLGYTPSQVSRCYFKLVGFINLGILAVSICVMFIAGSFWAKPLQQLEISSASPLAAIAIGTAIMLVITGINFLIIRRSIVRAFR